MRKKSASIKRKKRGFTLVELLLVMAIIGVISSISIISLISFQRHQRLVNAAREVNAGLNLAKSRAQSQVKPNSCGSTQVLNGYKFTIYNPVASSPCTEGATCYRIVPVCNNIDMLQDAVYKKLPIGITYSSGFSTYTFKVLSGNVVFTGSNPLSELRLTNGTDSIKITIYRDGRVSLDE